MTPSEIQLILSAVSQMLQEQRTFVGEHGVAVSGSWSAVDNTSQQIEAGTVEVTSGKTAAIIGDDGDTGIAKPRIDVATTQIGDQYGPRGDERVIMIPTETGSIALFMHGSDDSPGAPAGERWICHRNASGVIDSYIKLTNDSDTSGDGLGGLKLGFGALSEIETTGGHKIVLDDGGKTVTVQSAGGLKIVLNDSSNAITFGSSGGATFQFANSGTTSTDGVVRKSDLQAALTALAAIVQPGSGVTAPTATASTKTFTA